MKRDAHLLQLAEMLPDCVGEGIAAEELELEADDVDWELVQVADAVVFAVVELVCGGPVITVADTDTIVMLALYEGGGWYMQYCTLVSNVQFAEVVFRAGFQS